MDTGVAGYEQSRLNSHYWGIQSTTNTNQPHPFAVVNIINYTLSDSSIYSFINTSSITSQSQPTAPYWCVTSVRACVTRRFRAVLDQHVGVRGDSHRQLRLNTQNNTKYHSVDLCQATIKTLSDVTTVGK